MALSQSDIDIIIALWKYQEQQADPRAPEDQVVSGLRREDLVSCQYWIKGHSPVCNYWSDDTGCGFEIPDGEQSPSGYNNKNCDYLGRRSTCNRYEASEVEKLDEYICILPNIFLSGTGKKSGSSTTGITLSPISKDDIRGYCKGLCDGFGHGTGCDGSDPINDPVVCNYFRPWQMGFGALQPKDIRRRITEKGEIYITPEDLQAAYDDLDTAFGKRVPLSFSIYNLRAEFQKCAYWDSDEGVRFEVANDGKISLEDDDIRCTCTDALCTPYKTLATPPASGTQSWLLDEVWAEANTVICNGAKPECPFYTGEWVYCNDINMLYGMRVTANQLFELRFWTSQWGSQNEYDDFFKSKPNWQDVPTADVYTFKKWDKIGETAADSVAAGQILHMCQPASLNNRRFVPNKFLKAKDIKYTAAGINMGTTAPASGQVYYPTLIRDPDLKTDIWKIDIIYPYTSTIPFSSEVCNAEKDPLGIKRGSDIDGDTISVIGITERDSDVYVFNLTILGKTLAELEENWNIRTISDVKKATKQDEGNLSGLSPRYKFFERLEDFIDDIQKTAPEYLSKTSSDSETGYFKSKPLDLKYGEVNRIVVCVKVTDTVWDFRIRPVLSKWYGGLIVQNSFNQEDTGQYLPKKFKPNAQITGTIYPLIDNAGNKKIYGIEPACTLGSIIHSASNTWTDAELSTRWMYYYCYKKVTVNDAVINNWANIGNSGLVWVEIEDKNISYLFEWGINSAKITYIGSEEDEQPHTEVEMEEVIIETFVSGKRSVPPSACVIKPADSTLKKMFLSGDWELEISYWYKEISNNTNVGDSIEIIEPDFNNSHVSFGQSEFNLIIDEDSNTFTINNVEDDTMAFMGLFKEEDGRTIAAMATKLLVQISMPECRNVEIDYRYQQPTLWYKLLPDTSSVSLAIPPTSEKLQGEYSARYSRPFCGDHKNGNDGLGKGAMWYPFTRCDQWDFYQAYAGAAFCTNWYQDCPRDDMRFCGPTKYTAFVAPGGGAVFADCVLLFHYRYSVTTSEPTFVGYANIVAYADPAEYAGYNWTMPPFGNKGREMVNKWLSQDNWVHLSVKNSVRPYVTQQWIPLVPDNTDFFVSFNAFSESSVVSPDSFMHINQLSFFKSELIEEKVSTERNKFEDVFGTRGIYSASYPTPLLTQGQITKALHYYFKNTNTAWAWREYWEDIEYVDSDRSLYFVTYSKPNYVYDYEKVEHRYICGEGNYPVKYEAPVIEKGELIQYPSIQLGNGPKRFFNIVYDDYSVHGVDWMDEGSGDVGGSVGEEGEEPNIYEVTSPTGANSKWNHDSNCLFDNTAVRTYELAEAAGRKIEQYDIISGIQEAYYNTGIIVNLDRSALNYLPYNESANDLPFTHSELINDSLGKGVYSWYNSSPKLTVDLTTDSRVRTCFSEIKITGSWGLDKRVVDKSITERSVCIPGVTIVEKYGDDESRTLITKAAVEFDKDVYGDIGVTQFTLVFKLKPTVDRMLNKPATYLEINLDCSRGQYIYLDFVNMKKALYTDATEIINVNERRYVTSTSTKFGDHNIDGPKVGNNFVLQYDFDFDNSGTYYAVSPVFTYVPEEEIKAKDKMRAVYASEQYREDTPLDIDINNISQIEQEEQMKLYVDALSRDVDGDVSIYSFVMPPALQSFFDRHNIQVVIRDMLTFTTRKPTWDKHSLHKSYIEGALWYPQGHKYQWGDGVTRRYCYEIDYMPEYGSSGGSLIVLDEPWFLHMDTNSKELPVDPVTALYANRMLYQIEAGQKFFGEEAVFVEAGKTLGTAASFVDNSNVGDVGVITY